MDENESINRSSTTKSRRNLEIEQYRRQIMAKQFSRDMADGLTMPRGQTLSETISQSEEERKIRRRANRVTRTTAPNTDNDPQSLRNQARQMMMSPTEPVYVKPPVPSYIRDRVQNAISS